MGSGFTICHGATDPIGGHGPQLWPTAAAKVPASAVVMRRVMLRFMFGSSWVSGPVISA